MFLATSDNNGRKRYFSAFTGKEVKPIRVRGTGGNRLPDYALRYLTAGPRKAPPPTIEPAIQRMEHRNIDRAMNLKAEINLKVKFSWLKRFWNWIKGN